MLDKNFRKDARKFIADNCYAKGKLNLTLSNFTKLVKEEKGVSVCVFTASVWLHDMGFAHKQFSKGVYFNGHKCDDVHMYLADRRRYIHVETLVIQTQNVDMVLQLQVHHGGR